MHPQYKSDRPGDAPCCGMRLEPVYADSANAGAPAALPDGAIHISTAQQQLIGVRTGDVKRAAASYRLRLPGRVKVDEERLHRVIAGVSGWIRTLGENSAGTFVKRDQVLTSYYTPNFLGAQQSFLFALRTVDPPRRTQIAIDPERAPSSLTLQTAIDTLRDMGLNDAQIDTIQKQRTYLPEVQLTSPISGYVIARNISPGQRFEKGSTLYEIADIGRLWVMTDIFEKDREFIKPGTMATVLYDNREFQARMSDVLPQFDPESRTLKTRFDVDNLGHVLRPGMFVDVELHVRMPDAITVPADAVIDTGRRKTVFVDLGLGAFEPRTVVTGWRLGDRVEITGGLEPGERIVVAGNFLIDSESRMKVANVAMTAEAPAGENDPVCGMNVDPKAANALKTEHNGKTYYFCSAHCKRTFDANPAKYAPKPAASEPALARDVVCGMDVDPKDPAAIKVQHNGKTFYFCAPHCKRTFEANPQKYDPKRGSAADFSAKRTAA